MSKVGRGVEISVSWTKCQSGYIPDNAVEAGPGVFVARGELNPGEWVPGKVATGHDNCFIPFGSQSNELSEYEVLIHTCTGCYGQGVEWIAASGGNVPKRAIIGGNSADGEPQYIARGYVNGEVCAGKLHAPHGCAYFAWGPDEHSLQEYDVLCACKC